MLSKPSLFRGEHGTRVYDWISEFEILFPNLDSHISAEQKVIFARQFLREEALRWLVARERDVAAHLAEPIRTWDSFKSALIEYFCPRGASETARNEIHQMRQHQYRDLATYADSFESVSRRIEVPVGHSIDDELIATFKHGLSDGQVRLHLTSAKPKSLFEAVKLALQAESDLRVSRVHAGGRLGPSRRPVVGFRPSNNSNRFYSDHSRQQFHRAASSTPYRCSTSTPHGNGGHHQSSPMELGAMLDDPSGSEPEWDEWSGRDNDEHIHDEECRSLSPSSPRDGSPSDDEAGRDDRRASRSEIASTSQSCAVVGPARQQSRFTRDRPSRGEGCWTCGGMDHLARDCRRSASSTSVSKSSARTPPRTKSN
jgi:hypothetical protein